MNDNPEHSPAAPSKAAKLIAVLAFFILLFFMAGLIGLPMPTSLVFTFFFAIAAPVAFIFSLLVVLLFRFVGNLSGRTRPLFDIGLQTFLIASLLVTGLFVARFPDWLRTNLPAVQSELETRLTPEHTEAEKKRFLGSFAQFWKWNVSYLLNEGREPTVVQEERLQKTMSYFGEALSPECDDCEPELTRVESQQLVELMNGVTGYAGSATGAVDKGDVENQNPPSEAASDPTGPTTAP